MNHKILANLFSFEDAKSVFKGISSFVENNMYTVNVSEIDWCLDQVLEKIFQNIPTTPTCEFTSVSEKPIIQNHSEFRQIQHRVSRITFYKKTPIFLNIEMPDENKQVYTPPRIFLKTINTKKNRAVLMEFVAKLCAKGQRSETMNWGENGVYLDGPLGCKIIRSQRMRTFDNIFVPDQQLDKIKTSIDSFVSRKEWYIEHGIPYHFGILLHGDPGTGKSVIAQAIAKYMNARLFVISGDAVKLFPDMLGRQIQSDTIAADVYQVILIEDIDCGLKQIKEDESKEHNYESTDIVTGQPNERPTGLAGILNSIDGVVAPTNTVFIFTTNHLEQLDPALVRPGRCDLSLEIKHVSWETFNKFCKYHYGESAPSDLILRDGVLFGELQGEVMRGRTFKELCEFVRKEVNTDEKKNKALVGGGLFDYCHCDSN